MAQARPPRRFLLEQGGNIEAWISRPEIQVPRHPALVLLPGRNGPTNAFIAASYRFSEEGFVTLALNTLSNDPDPSDDAHLRMVEAAAAYLRGRADVAPDQIAVGGYCRGGELTILTLGTLTGFAAGISWHGRGWRPDVNERHPIHAADRAHNITAPLLIIHGASDTTVPVQGIYRLTDVLNGLGKVFELKVYAGAEHAFTLAGTGHYKEREAGDAFREGVLFLRRTFGQPLGTVGPFVSASV